MKKLFSRRTMLIGIAYTSIYTLLSGTSNVFSAEAPFAERMFARKMRSQEDSFSDFTDFSNGSSINIAFIANSRGLVEPCPTCGFRALGGLARRASVLKRLRRGDVPCVYVAGPYELKASSSLESVAIQRQEEGIAQEQICSAHSLCSADIGCSMQCETACFGTLPKGFASVQDKPIIKKISPNGIRLAFVLFPELPKGAEYAPSAMVKAVLEAGRSVRDSDIVIGVSPWGFKAEGRALSSFEGVFDILLGGGVGAPFPLDVPQFAPSVAWSRSDSDGRNIIVLSIADTHFSRPHTWIKGVDIWAREIPLNATIPEDKAVRRILTQK